MKPKKLIREFITGKLKEGEWETIIDQDELNQLYAIKIREELAEVQASDHKDIFEFVDLIQVVFSFAKQNGFNHEQLSSAMTAKSLDKGYFGRLALNNLNPDNPSNALYFEKGSDNNSLLDAAFSVIPLDVQGSNLSCIGWIPVTEILPENFRSVLCHTHIGDMVVQSYGLHTEQDDKWFRGRFTHWMELPLPPAFA